MVLFAVFKNSKTVR